MSAFSCLWIVSQVTPVSMAGNPGIHILLTRPAAQSTAFAHQLRQKFGDRCRILMSPLLEIRPVAFDVDLADLRGLLVTSTNGIQAFAQATSRRDIPCVCVGRSTADAAISLGFKAVSVDGTAADLVAYAAKMPRDQTGRLLYIRGKHAAAPIADQLTALGVPTRDLIVYDQKPLPLDAPAIAVLDGPEPVIVPLYSRRSAEIFASQTVGLRLGNVTPVCISQNVADCLDVDRFQAVLIADQPNSAALTRKIAAIM